MKADFKTGAVWLVIGAALVWIARPGDWVRPVTAQTGTPAVVVEWEYNSQSVEAASIQTKLTELGTAGWDVFSVTSTDAVVDDTTAIVSACHGYYENGCTQDLSAIAAKAHAEGALVYVDAYQTLGTTPVNVKASGVDFLASGCLKFLMGIPGIAFLYVRKELIKTLRPTVTGWFGRANPFGFDVKKLDWARTASRFDSGTPPVLNAYVARAGIEIVTGLGVGKIRAWHEVLAQRLIDGGRERGLMLHGPADVSRKTATTGFVVPDAHGVEACMRVQGVIASARGPVIRLSPHFYNTIEDVDRALDVLAVVAIPA